MSSVNRQIQRGIAGISALIVVALTLMLTMPAFAAEVTKSIVERDKDVFQIKFEVQIDAALDDVSRLVGEYQNLAAMSPSTLTSRLINAGNGINTDSDAWIHVVLKPCVLIFCKRLEKVSRIVQTAGDTTRYDGIRAHSSFIRTTESLTLRGDSTSTSLIYGAELEPDFYVPGVIGAWIVRRVIVEEMHAAAKKAEQMIQAANGN